MLDVLAESMKGQKLCPILSQGVNKPQKCIGKFCEFFLEFKDRQGKPFSRCAYVAAPMLILETKIEIEALHHSFLTIVEAAQGVKK